MPKQYPKDQRDRAVRLARTGVFALGVRRTLGREQLERGRAYGGVLGAE